MIQLLISIDKRLYDRLTKLAESYNMDVEIFIENQLEEELDQPADQRRSECEQLPAILNEILTGAPRRFST